MAGRTTAVLKLRGPPGTVPVGPCPLPAEVGRQRPAADADWGFDGYPAVLARLGEIDVDYLSAVLLDAWLTRVPQRVALTSERSQRCCAWNCQPVRCSSSQARGDRPSRWAKARENELLV